MGMLLATDTYPLTTDCSSAGEHAARLLCKSTSHIMTVTRILRIVAITDLQYVHDSIINYEYRIYENSIKPYYIE